MTFSFIALTPLHCQIGLIEHKDRARGFFIPAMILFVRREKRVPAIRNRCAGTQVCIDLGLDECQ